MKKQARIPLGGIERIKKARELLGAAYLADALKCSPNTVSVAFMGIRHGPVARALHEIGQKLDLEALQQIMDNAGPVGPPHESRFDRIKRELGEKLCRKET
jgi:hypothetical protein